MASNDSHRNSPPRSMRSPIASAVILLVFYIAMYLAIAAAVRVIDPSTVDNVASDPAPAPLASAPATPPAEINEYSYQNDGYSYKDGGYSYKAHAPRRMDAAHDCQDGAKGELQCAAD